MVEDTSQESKMRDPGAMATPLLSSRPLRDAGEVYIKMHKNYRVSRNVRAHWFFDHINKTIKIENEQTKDGCPSSQEMSVVGIVPRGGTGDEIVEGEEFLVAADTKVIYLSRYYRHVFVLDLSPSTFVSDDREGCCLHQKLLTTLRLSMANVAKTFMIPGTTSTFSPQIYATVCVFVPFLGFEEDLVLVQGNLLTEANVSEVVDQVTVKFNEILIKLYEFSRPIMQKWGQLRRRHRNKFDSFTEVNARGEVDYSDMVDYQARRLSQRREAVEKYGRFFELPKVFEESDDPLGPHLQDLRDSAFPSQTKLFKRDTLGSEQKKIAWNVTDEQRDDSVDAKVDGYIHPEWSLVFMLRLGLIATQMMPENTQSGIIVITDAVCGIPDQEAMQKLLAQLRSYTVSCSFIQLQANTGKGACFGHVPSSELVHFIAMATFGSYISPEDVGHIKIEPNKVPDILKSAPGTPKDEEEPPSLMSIEELTQAKILEMRASEGVAQSDDKDIKLNPFHRALLCWSFQNALQQHNANVAQQIQTVNKEFLEFFIDDIRRHVHFRVQYTSNLHELLYVRLREGFALKEVKLEDDGRTIYVLLVLPFRSQLFIEYTLRAPWPATRTRGPVFVELILQGPAFELREILSERKHLGTDRQDLVKITLNSIIEADALLLQLHEFNTRPGHYRIPKGINAHEGLFTIHNGLLRTPYAQTKKLLLNGYAELVPFADFWATLLDMNDSLWQKWVHTHSERIVLKCTLPFETFGSDKLFQMNCSDSEAALHSILQAEATFSVIPDKLYVTFVYGDNKDAPDFFYIVRVCLAPPTVILRISFLGGIKNHTRREIIDSMRKNILEFNRKKMQDIVELENRRIQPDASSDTASLCFYRRPMERILVRYDTIPFDLKTIVRIRENLINASLDQIKQIKRHNAICNYMECRRLIIILPDLCDAPAFSLPENCAIAEFILNVLIKRRSAEKEGYQVAGRFESEALAMCRQRFPSGPSLQQYILFPPVQVELPTVLRQGESKKSGYYSHNVLTSVAQRELNESENQGNELIYDEEETGRRTRKVHVIDAKSDDHGFESSNRPLALVLETWNEPQVCFGKSEIEGHSHASDTELVSVLYSIDVLMRLSINKVSHEDPALRAFYDVDRALSIEKNVQRLCLSSRVTLKTSVFSYTNALKHADKEKIQMPLMMKENQLSFRRIALMLNVLHHELIEEVDTFVDCDEIDLWKVLNEEKRPELKEVGSRIVRRQKSVTIKENKPDSIEKEKSSMKCRLYLRQLSQWELAVFIVPLTRESDFYRDGIPIHVCVLSEPKIAYDLAKRLLAKVESTSSSFVPPSEWYSMRRDYPSSVPSGLTAAELKARFESGLSKQVNLTMLMILMSLGEEVRKDDFKAVKESLTRTDLPIYRLDDKLQEISRKGENPTELSRTLNRIVHEHFCKTPFDDSLYFPSLKRYNSISFLTNLMANYEMENEIGDTNFDIERLQKLSAEARNSAFEWITSIESRGGVVWKNKKPELRPTFLFFSFSCSIEGKDGKSNIVTTKSIPTSREELENSHFKLNDDSSKISLQLRLFTLKHIQGLFEKCMKSPESDYKPQAQLEGISFQTRTLLSSLIEQSERAFELERLLCTSSKIGEKDTQQVARCFETLKAICGEAIAHCQGVCIERRRIHQLQCLRGRELWESFIKSFDGTLVDYGKMRRLSENTFYCCGVENPAALVKYESVAKRREVGKVKSALKQDTFKSKEDRKSEKGRRISAVTAKYANFQRIGSRKDDFWLFLVIENNCADIFFCQRYDTYLHDHLLHVLSRIVRRRSHRMNQVLLLSRMYHKKRAEDLLIPRDTVKKRRELNSRRKDSYLTDDDEEECYYASDADDDFADLIEDEEDLELIQNELDKMIIKQRHVYWMLPEVRYFYPPGHFACVLQEALWFRIHSRLRTKGAQPTQQASVTLLQCLQRFIVKNRTHTYVLKDPEDPHRHNVIYMRLHLSMDYYADSINGGKMNAVATRLKRRQVDGMKHRFKTEILITVCSLETPRPTFLHSIRDTINRKLDETTLAQIISVFVKNSQTKLSAEDVQFIQKDPQIPSLNLFISIPKQLAGYLSAVLYYSQQHLQAVLSLAKFKDEAGEILTHESKSGSKESSGGGGHMGRGECIESGSSHSLPGRRTFMPYKVEGEMPSSYQPAFFLHLKTSRPGSTATGICCIEFRIVNPHGEIPEQLPDGRLNENSSQLLAPILNSSKERVHLYRDLTKAQCYATCVPRDDIAAYAQAIVWQAGDVDLVDVQQSLEGVVKMALCDVVTEYGVLNGQIVETGTSHSIGSGGNPPPMSPALHDTPNAKTPQSASSQKLTSIIAPPPTPASDPKRQQLRKRESLDTAGGALQGQGHLNTPYDSGGKATKFPFDQPPPLRRGSNASELDKSSKSMHGEEFVLPQLRHPDTISTRFATISADWFPYLCELVPDCTSIYRQTWAFDCKQTVKKALTVVRDQIRKHAESQESIILYEWSNVDRSHEYIEGVDGKYEAVAQSIQQNVSTDLPTDPSLTETSQPVFVLVGLVTDVSIETKRYGFEPVGDTPETLKEFAEKQAVLFIPRLDMSFIPRQRILYGVVRGSQFTLYFYNYHPTISTSIREIVTKTVHWHNARARLMREIGLHKIGITHLSPYGTDIHSYTNPYLALVWRNPDELIDKDYPSDIPPEMPHFEKLPPEYAQVLFRIFRDKCNSRMSESTCLITSQMERLKSIRACLAKRLNHYRTGKTIQNAFFAKNFRMREEDLTVLLRHCRLVHFVHTPVLLFPSWRRKIAEVRGKMHDSLMSKSGSSTTLTHTGSMSDVALQTRRKASTPQGNAPQSPVSNFGSATRARTNTVGNGNSLSITPTSQSMKATPRLRSGDDPCMIKILYMLMNDYIRYMKTLDLEFVEITELCKTSEDQRLYGTQFSLACSSPPRVVLAAPTQGGIIFMLLSFAEPYFVSEFYTWTGDDFEGRIHLGESSVDALFNMEEYLNELKTKCHIHSFTYDFHLRILSKYLVGKDEVLFNSGYNTHAFLIDFLEYYGCRPPNARNCVYQEHTKFELQHAVSASMIWEHFLNNNGIYRWRVVKLRNFDEIERSQDDHMLVCESGTEEEGSDRELIRVVLRDRNKSEATDKISLTFYLIAVSTKQVEPLEEERRRRDDSDNSSSGEFKNFERRTTLRPSFDSGDSSPRLRSSSITTRRGGRGPVDDTSDKADEMARMINSGIGMLSMNPDGSLILSSSLSTSALRRRCSSGGQLYRMGREQQTHSAQKENENPNATTGAQKSSSDGKTPRYSDAESVLTTFQPQTQKGAESDGEMQSQLNRQISIQSSSTAPRRHRKHHEGDIPDEQIIYVYYQSGRQKRLQKALEDCVVDLSLSLKKNVENAQWLCRRDMMWQKILSLPTGNKPPVHSRLSIFLGNSAKNQDPWFNLRCAASEYCTSELETLISMVDKESMNVREPRLKELLQGSSCARLCRFLFARFGSSRCRFFEYPNSVKKALLITNPDDINTLFLVICEHEHTPSLSVLFKEKDDEPSAPTKLFRQQRLDSAFDDLIACVTAFLWSDLLQKPPGYT